jgi:thiol:disulfide interchange protein DsbD
MDAATVLVRFTPLSGYYLYRDKFVFEIEAPSGYRIEQIQLPPGVIKDDPEFGPVPVYFDAIEIPLTLSRPAGPEQQIILRAEFQGCKDGEICLPPQSERIELTLDGSITVVPGADRAGQAEVPQSEQDRLARLLTQNPPMALLAFFVAGLLLAFTPCVFPMVPILSGLIAGQGQQLTTLRAFNLSLVYVLAMSLTYTLAGVLAGLFGQNLQAAFQSPWIISSFVAVFVVLALSMFGLFELQLPGRWQTALTERSNRQKGGRYAGVAVMGLLSALIVGPCVAPPLAAALIVIGASGDAMLGGSALFALSMGMGVPLIAFGVSAGKLIPTAGAWMDAIKKLFGVGLLALGIWMLERILAGPIILLLWGILAVGCGIYLGALQRLPGGASGRDRLIQALGMVLLVLGILELVGAASGGDRWTEPLRQLRLGQSDHAEQAPDFQRIKSLQDLEKTLNVSIAEGRVSLFDFYADWCVECIRMERTTFPEESVASLMSEFALIQADVTPNDEIDQALMSRFGIIGPPAILFFDRQGEEMRAFRLIGYFTPDDFAKHLERVLENG